MEIFLSNRGLVSFLYSVDLPWWVALIKMAFQLYPPFNFSKSFSDISYKAGSHFDNFEFKWKKGEGYTWSDFTERWHGVVRPNIEYDVFFS